MSVSVPALITLGRRPAPVGAPASAHTIQRHGPGIRRLRDSVFDRLPGLAYVLSRDVILPPETSTRLKDLVPDSDRPQTKGVGANSTWLKGHLTAEGEVANNATNDAGMSTRIDRCDDGGDTHGAAWG